MTGHYYEMIPWSLCYSYNYKMQTSTIVEPLTRTLITADNWTLPFGQFNRFSKQVNLANAETSLSTVYYNKPSSSDGK